MKNSALIVFGLSIVLSACASTGGGPKGGLPSQVEIAFKGKAGETSQTHYYSNARILTFSEGQLLRDRTEGVDFVVDQHMIDVKPERLIYNVTTVAKDGAVELHDLAFPELHEQLQYTVKPDGEVLRVSNLPPQSLFFTPALPTPKGKVSVGDTWAMEHIWASSKDGIPLKLQVVAILKDIVACEKTRVCADIELNGDVNLVAVPVMKGAKFASKLWGRVLFSIDRGDVIWSEMRSTEEMGLPKDRLFVRSCMISEMKNAAAKSKVDFSCDPNQETVTKTPVY